MDPSNAALAYAPPQVAVTARAADLLLEHPAPLAPAPHNIGTWLRENAARYPHKPFVLQRDAGGTWSGPTHAEALARVNRLSRGLIAAGLDADRPLAILSENSVEMALAQLAAMQVGVPVAPISNAYSTLSQTGGHIRHILDVTAAPVLLMSDADVHMRKLGQWDLGALLPYAVTRAERHAGVQPLAALEVGDGMLDTAARARFDAVTPTTLAKIQFTSGSTNLPKGVEVTHGMMTSNQAGIAQVWPFVGPDEVVVDFLPWNHTFGGNFV
ncbi:MAG TPA: AMP-binding protein, partial [Ktedonobacterales bacterium]|nr:AMP-binding protein [Ktedonobacterales bacterium]